MAGTPQEVSDKWVRRTQAATEDMRRGIMAVTESPTARAAAQKNAMLQRLQESVNNGKWERGLARVSLQDWKNAAAEKGVQRVAAGVQSAQPKMTAFLTQFLPYAEQVSQQVRAMPKVTLEDSIARSTATIRAMAQFSAQRR